MYSPQSEAYSSSSSSSLFSLTRISHALILSIYSLSTKTKAHWISNTLFPLLSSIHSSQSLCFCFFQILSWISSSSLLIKSYPSLPSSFFFCHPNSQQDSSFLLFFGCIISAALLHPRFMAAAASAATVSQVFQNHHSDNNGVEVSRQEIQAAIAKAVELRALHAALTQGNYPPNLRYPSSSSSSPVSRPFPLFSAQDYPVFTPVS